MGGIAKAAKGLLGGGSDGAGAAGDAAQAQLASTREAIKYQRESRDLARSDLAPYRDLGQRNIAGAESLINDPTSQLNFIRDNPFFQSLAKRSTDTILNNAAARGKVGSGGTAEALQNSLLLLGQDLVNNSVNQRLNLVNVGQNSAAGSANIAQNTGNAIADLTTQGGNAQAAGIIGAQNARTAANNNLINTGLGIGSIIALSDLREKRNLQHIGYLENGIKVYLFQYLDSDDVYKGVIAQEVQEVFPEAVIEIDGRLHVDYSKILKVH